MLVPWASKKTIIWRLQVQSSLQASNIQEYLTLVPGYGKTESEQVTPMVSIKDNRLKRCGNNNKDEDNSLKNLNDRNQQASSQKFRQLIKNILILSYNWGWVTIFWYIIKPDISGLVLLYNTHKDILSIMVIVVENLEKGYLHFTPSILFSSYD